MASNKGWDRHFVTLEGSTMKTGRSLNLAKGQFAIVDMESAPTARGNEVVSSFGSFDKSRKLEMRLGIAPLAVTRSQSNKAMSTPDFKISEVIGLKVNAPKVKGIPVDHFRIGYDGLRPETAIVLQNGDNESIEVNISGKPIGLLGYDNSNVTVKLYLDAPNGDVEFTNQEIIEKAVERFNRMTLIGGVPITNYVEARVVNSESVALTGTDWSFFKLTLTDNGDHSALGLVQAQYPDHRVVRESYMGGVSVYTILAPADTTLADYQITTVSKLPDCDECPTGFTLTDGLCVADGDPTEIAWVAEDTCKVSTETYTITLADDECGNNRLSELQAHYPDLTIAVATQNSANSARSFTITGTSGTANITIAGTNYLATYETSPTVTATNFMTSHKTAIEAATGGVLTRSGATITLTAATSGFPTIAAGNVSGDLGATVGSVAVVAENIAGACMTTYTTTVNTNVLCEQCAPEVNGIFTSEAPEPFDGIDWTKNPKTYSEDALMGIDFVGKATVFTGNEQFRDEMPAIASPVRLSISSGGSITSESFKEGRLGRMAVKLMSRAQEPENYGFMFYDWEERSRVHHEGRQRLEGNNFGKWALGQETHLKPTAQYVDYVLSFRRVRMGQSFSGEVVENFNYHILAEVGKHKDVEDVLNALATAAGLDTVEAYS